MAKARIIRPSKGRNFRGKFPSIKMDRTVEWESLLERDYIKVLEFDPEVMEYESQPLVIEYVAKGKNLRYYPDFKVIRKNNKTSLVEVKPKMFLNDPDNQLKFHVGKMFCERQGWNYQVVVNAVFKFPFFAGIKFPFFNPLLGRAECPLFAFPSTDMNFP